MRADVVGVERDGAFEGVARAGGVPRPVEQAGVLGFQSVGAPEPLRVEGRGRREGERLLERLLRRLVLFFGKQAPAAPVGFLGLGLRCGVQE